MRIRVPRRKVRERFLLIYELEGCQKAVDFLTKYYKVKRMKIILDGRRVGNGEAAVYFENKAYFKRSGLPPCGVSSRIPIRGLKKRTVLHELYHHLVDVNGLEIPDRIEEKDARDYARDFLSC